MDYGTSRLDELRGTIHSQQVFVRAALDRDEDGWALRACQAVIGSRPPTWRPAKWEYQRLVLLAAEVRGPAFLSAFSPEGDQVLSIESLEVIVPPVDVNMNWRHQPSRALHDMAPLPWPTCDYEIHRKNQFAGAAPQGFLVGDDCPSFPDDQTAVRAFFYGDFSMIEAQAVFYELARIRVVQREAWIERVRVTPSHLDVRVGGDASAGTRVEVNGSTLQAWKRVGTTGRVRLPLRGGLPDDAWLYLSRDKRWLDYRMLGPRLYGARSLAASGVSVELPDDPEGRLQALLAVGEGPRLEFKSALPDSTDEGKRKVLKTVAAFANGDGGTIVFGMDPDELTPLNLAGAGDPRTRDRLGDLIRGIVVPTPVFEVQPTMTDGNRLLVLTVQAGASQPYGLQFGKNIEFYVRRGANTYPATQAEIRASALSTAPPADPLAQYPGGL